jgi:hypothetical protein
VVSFAGFRKVGDLLDARHFGAEFGMLNDWLPDPRPEGGVPRRPLAPKTWPPRHCNILHLVLLGRSSTLEPFMGLEHSRREFLKVTLAGGAVMAGASCGSLAEEPTALVPAAEERKADERLSFQASSRWSPRVNLNADVAMVYGIDPSMPERIATWRDKGYIVHVMTGVAWGQYQDYVSGRWDGKNHEDQIQTDRFGKKHGHGGDVYYMSPGQDYGRYLCEGVKRAIDAGAQAIHLEEPEFWVGDGYEENFKREWKAYYADDWIPPHTSPDAQYRASKLKYYLYRRALAQVFDFVRAYSKGKVRCYVPTHSLINYAHWRIVSPESSLLEVGCDGYIAQVWTGTARTPNVYEGKKRERTFETAFLEYGAMQNLVRASGRRVWYLNDPIEDNPNHTWEDYRYNWECTLVASLFQSEVWHYEIMPWPDRIFTRPYPSTAPAPAPAAAARSRGRRGVGAGNRIMIPHAYETELQAVIAAMGDMKQSSVRWEKSGSGGIGILASDTMMFQRGQPNGSDDNLGSFYGLALPLLKRGVLAEAVQIECAHNKGFLDRYQALLLTYEGQKPPTAKFHQALADWVNKGGKLIIVDDEKDPFCAVKEWWNSGDKHYATPRQHLYELLKLGDKPGQSAVGKGLVVWAQLSPAAMTYQPDGAERLRRIIAAVFPFAQTNALVLRRGPYVIAAGLDESIPNKPATKLTGQFINLFEAALPLVNGIEIAPGKRYLLVDLDVAAKKEGVIAAACRVSDQNVAANSITFRATGIAQTQGIVCAAMLSKPARVTVDGKETESTYADGILWIKFDNAVEPRTIEIRKRM